MPHPLKHILSAKDQDELVGEGGCGQEAWVLLYVLSVCLEFEERFRS